MTTSVHGHEVKGAGIPDGAIALVRTSQSKHSNFSVCNGSSVFLLPPTDFAYYYGIWVAVENITMGELLVGKVIKDYSRGIGFVTFYDNATQCYWVNFEGSSHIGRNVKQPSTGSAVKPQVGAIAVSVKEVHASHSWQWLSHGGSHFGRRNDAGYGLSTNQQLPQYVGDYVDSDMMAHENAEWIARRKAWYSKRRSLHKKTSSIKRVDSDHSSNSDDCAIVSSWGIPPLGYILDIQEQVDFEQKRSFVLTCARYFVPEDTALGRQSWQDASDIFFALENSENEPGKYQLLTQKLEVDDLGSVIQSFVNVDGRPFHTSPDQNIGRQRTLSFPSTCYSLRLCYCLSDDSYSTLSPVIACLNAWNTLGDNTFDIERCSPFISISSPASSRASKNDSVHKEAAISIPEKTSKLVLRESAIGRWIYFCIDDTERKAINERESKEAVTMGQPKDSQNNETGKWVIGRVTAYNASNDEYFVEHDAERQRGDWFDLKGKSFRWLQHDDPSVAGERRAPFSISWCSSAGCWLAVMEECANEVEDVSLLSRSSSNSHIGADPCGGSFPLHALLSNKNVERWTQPFNLPASVLEILEDNLEGIDLTSESPYVECSKQQDELEGRKKRPSRLPIHEESCARARSWSKISHDSMLHRSGLSAGDIREDASDEVNEPESKHAAARARKSRSEARRFRGSGCGAARTLWEDGRLEKGGAGTGSRRLRFGRSHIQGWGVYTDEHISNGEAVLEYRGELIGNAVADLRERCYRRENREDYMFRIDDNLVVDATKRGSLARYVNHSCDPNCFTQITEYGTKKKIIIYAKRDILAGEELKYDYKFTTEYMPSKKLPCYCGARNCKLYMN